MDIHDSTKQKRTILLFSKRNIILLAGLIINYLIISYRHGEFKDGIDAIYYPLMISAGLLICTAYTTYAIILARTDVRHWAIFSSLLLSIPIITLAGTDWIKDESRVRIHLKNKDNERQVVYYYVKVTDDGLTYGS